MSQPSSIMKLHIPSAKLKELQKKSTSHRADSFYSTSDTSVSQSNCSRPQNVHNSAMQHFTATFRKKEDLVTENTALKSQLAVAQEQLAGVAQVQKQHEQDVAQLLEALDRRDKQLARVNELNSDAKVIVQEMAQMVTDTARQAQEVAQVMTNVAHRAQNLVFTKNDNDDI